MARSKGPIHFKPRNHNKAKTPPQSVLTLDIVDLSDEGRGVARVADKVVFVAGALPGERVEARVIRQHKRFDEAVMSQCLTPSSQRVAPFCAHFGHCGGCQLQQLAIDAQREAKTARLAKVLADSPLADQLDILLAKDTGYRHRARLSYRQGRLGFRAEGSHEVVDIGHCPILVSVLNQALAATREILLRYLSGVGASELVLAAGQDDRVGLRIDQKAPLNRRAIAALASDLRPHIALFAVGGADGDWTEAAAPLLYPAAGAQPLAFVPGDFTQANPAVNQQMLLAIGRWLLPRPGEAIADYFCGLGNFSQMLAGHGAVVEGFDLGEDMLRRAQAAADAQQLAIRYTPADLFNPAHLRLPQGVSKVVLDPPRAGAMALCEYLARKKSLTTVAYISCNPASLKRDLEILQGGGFRLESALAADMFPHSHHTESLVLLKR